MRYSIKEFYRYILVGGAAFVMDFTVLFLFKNFVFNSLGLYGIYISVALGFFAGLLFNYILSLSFVFETAKTKNKGKSIYSFIIFSLVGVAGLALTEVGMYIGVELFTINYLIVKIIVAIVVLIWNYSARKILIF